MAKGHICVDLDGTLAKYDGWHGHKHIGQPIQPMVDFVKAKIAAGETVKILTARVSGDPQEAAEVREAIGAWCLEQGLPKLEVTCIKDYNMIELYDDRAVQVEFNTGKIIGYSTRDKRRLVTEAK